MSEKLIHYQMVSRNETSAESILPLSFIKAHAYIVSDQHDEILKQYRAAAIDQAERYMNRAISGTKYRAYIPSAGTVILPMGAIAVDPLDAGVTYSFNMVTGKLTVDQPCFVTYTAGFLAIPESLKVALAIMVATFFENRASVTDQSVSTVPMINHMALFSNYRLPAGILMEAS